MSRGPCQPFNWFRFLADTAHLSHEQRSAYVLLLGHYWCMGKLPKDDEALANIARCDLMRWQCVRIAMIPFFGENWTHHRVESDIERATERAKKARESAAVRWKDKKKGKMRTHVPSQSDGNALALLSKDKESKRKEPTVPKERGTRLPENWCPEQFGYSEFELREHAKFTDYWKAKPGAGGVKLDWQATWRNWMRNANERRAERNSGNGGSRSIRDAAERLIASEEARFGFADAGSGDGAAHREDAPRLLPDG